MFIIDGLQTFLQSVYAQVVNIPVDNVWGAIYVVFQNLLLIWATLSGAGSS
ncbi:MAG: hypothetical protein QG656_1659 [Candidatus Hydrogenedentes bacterium]|jgi:hypothetical protein|nr:hypothetical protein [Candidatus Hydrogenedentota bacterium]